MAFATLATAQIGFIENKGQFDDNISYQADYNSHSIFLDKDGFSILLHDEKKWGEIVTDFHDNQMHSHNPTEVNDSVTLNYHFIKYKLIGANLANHTGTVSTPEYYNYFIGNDQSKWASNVAKHTKVVYRNIYPFIDLEYEAIDERFKYNFILNPGADIYDIKIDIDGAEEVRVTSERIYVRSRFGEFSEVMPISYEVRNNSRTQIRMSYVKRGKYIGFETPIFKGKVKTVIDPELIFSTYSGSSVDNFGFTATYDDEGHLYAGGIATSPTKFPGSYPATGGAFDLTFNGGEIGTFACDISLSKYSSDGSTLIYATYLGGNANDYPHSLIVDENNNLIVFGTTSSVNYPTTNLAYDRSSNGGTEIILTKFNANGSGLLGSTFIGGSGNDGINDNGSTRYFYADDYRGEVNLDSFGNIYVATSSTSWNFPTTTGAFQENRGGLQDGVVFSLNSTLTTMRWSTFFGGSRNDALYSVDLSPTGEVYVAGGTRSDQLATDGSFRSSPVGNVDGYIGKISNDGSSLLASTYFGTTSYDQILLLELDAASNVYVVGHSEGNVPTKGSVYSNPNGKQFIAKFDPDLKNNLVSTVYGSGGNSPDITINAFLVDECGKVYVSGWGTNSENPGAGLRNMPITDDAFQKQTDGQDFHLCVFEENMSSIIFASYFGGNLTGDHVDGGTSRFDKRGIVYQSVCSSCPQNSFQSRISDFPTTSGAFSENNPSPRCSNASFKMAFVPYNEKPDLSPITFNTDVADTVTVTILDTFEFNYTITDPDNDSLTVTITYPDELIRDLIDYQNVYKDEGSVTAFFRMFFTCKNAGDTFRIEVLAKDDGCPFSTDSTSFITIIVNPPPVLDPPDVLCLNFINDSKLRIDWEPTPSSEYFYRMMLYKIDPDGNRILLKTSYNQLAGSYTDSDVINPRERDYTYYLVVENICNYLGPQSYNLSSVKESEVPVEATYLKTTTVVGKNINVVFLKSTEDDFGHYEIYRGSRDKGPLRYITSVFDINDTIYVDSLVDVNSTSYCYKIRVADACGHLSLLSNIGCSIVIRGEALNEKGVNPRFKFDLGWDEYINWNGGVDEYELIRSVDTGSLRSLVRLPSSSLDYRDANLDYDWGGYWYSVIAYESEGSLDASSRSNDIYLIQPPLVFVPNAVTANGDNLNDSFGWSDVFVREFEMRVYNRWGEKVFETQDKNKKWAGDYKDGDLKYSNVYFWIVTYKGWDNYFHTDKGTLTIVK
ncbi:MAG: hypothetical protein COA58_06185 [Bacteroidetes bacterium]|nr:MAG: hypothetical protein COA58_06185 [Bacteroidota bacterium]